MSVLKSWDIDLLASEKKTLLNFLGLYSFLTVVLIGFVAFLYFNFQKDLMLQQKRATLQEYANTLVLELKQLHINFDKYRTYPRFEQFNSAIYDSSQKKIFATFKTNEVDLNRLLYLKEGVIYFISRPESYYLGSKYVVVALPADENKLNTIYSNIITYSFLALIFMVFLGYFLLRLLLRPMKNALHLLDRFIKDTTHELNTPVSAILSNIEMIDKNTLDEKEAKKIGRIETASKTIANIYTDLTYLTLNHKLMSHDEIVDMNELVQKRVEYFKTMIEAKKITLHLSLSRSELFIDRTKIEKVIDNILSNAIKYNKIEGEIDITLTQNSLTIRDSGIGIKEDKIKQIYERYKRFDESVGGFGIGLSIVNMIVKEYDLKIQIDSKLHQGTKVTLSW